MRPFTRFYVLIPQERVGVLIGKNGEVRKEIMKATRTLITVEEGGRIVIEPESPEVPPQNLLKARDIVMAIGLGFSPEKAMKLLNDEYVLAVIDVKDLVDSPNHLKRILGRIIGEKGKARKNIEEIAGVDISISEGKVAIIGEILAVEAAKRAIYELIEGKMHSTVYRHLENAMRRYHRRSMMDLWYKP